MAELSELEKQMAELSSLAADAQSQSKDIRKQAGTVRRKSRDLSDDLGEMMLASQGASDFWHTHVGKGRARRQSRDYTETTMKEAFDEIDADGDQSIDFEELKQVRAQTLSLACSSIVAPCSLDTFPRSPWSLL